MSVIPSQNLLKLSFEQLKTLVDNSFKDRYYPRKVKFILYTSTACLDNKSRLDIVQKFDLNIDLLQILTYTSCSSTIFLFEKSFVCKLYSNVLWRITSNLRVDLEKMVDNITSRLTSISVTDNELENQEQPSKRPHEYENITPQKETVKIQAEFLRRRLGTPVVMSHGNSIRQNSEFGPLRVETIPQGERSQKGKTGCFGFVWKRKHDEDNDIEMVNYVCILYSFNNSLKTANI